MNTRLVTLLAQTSYTDDAVEIINLTLKKPISRIIVDYNPYNGDQIYATGHPVRCITNIELIDGSKTLWQLNGAQGHALDFYHRKKEVPADIRYIDNNWSKCPIIIDFGRFLNDPEFAFDPTKFTNPQLKIETDMDAGGTIADAGRMSVRAIAFDDKVITPVGFLASREVKTYALTAEDHEYTKLPTDFPYRKLLIRAHTYGKQPEVQIESIKLDENEGDKVILDHTMRDIVQALMCDTPPYHESIIGPGNAAVQYFYCTPGYWVYPVSNTWAAGHGGGAQGNYNADGGRWEHIQEIAAPNFCAMLQGWCPHNVIEIPFGDQNDPADWYTLDPDDSLKLDILAGAGAGAGNIEIFIQQLRRY